MQDDEKFNEEDSPYSASSELPASVIFMEMMRQAAAKRSPATPETPADNAPSSTPQTPPQAETVDDAAPPLTDAAQTDVPEASSTPPPEAANAAPPIPQKPMTEAERQLEAKLEAQRVRRIKRRQEKRREHRVSILGGVLRAIMVVIPSALLMATILSWWTDPQFLKPEVRANLQAAIVADGATPIAPTITPTPNWGRHIGIVAGHSGPGLNGLFDPGAVCPDGLTELEINNAVAVQVVIGLRERGYIVDLLEEFDPRLQNYQSAAMVSIHANSCSDYGEYVSGFLVAKAEARPEGGIDTRLAECIAKYYGMRSGLDRHFGLTRDMTDYHTFREIHPTTPAAIIELGFMLADRETLTERPDALAQGIIEGILCFVEPEFDTLPPALTATPTLPPP